MKSFVVLVLMGFLVSYAFGQEDGTFFKEMYEDTYIGPRRDFSKLRLKYKKDKNKIKLIEREWAIEKSRFNTADLNAKVSGLTKQEMFVFMIQEFKMLTSEADYLNAIALLDDLEIKESEMTIFQLATVYSLKGMLFRRFGDYYSALQFHTKAEPLFERSKAKASYLMNANNTMKLFIRFDRWDLCREKVSFIKNKKKKLLDRYSLLRGDFLLFEVLMSYDDENFEEAFRYFHEIIELNKQSGDSIRTMQSYINLGMMHARRQNVGRMIECIEISQKYASNTLDFRSRTRFLISMYGYLLWDKNYTQQLLNVLEFNSAKELEDEVENRLKKFKDEDLNLHYLFHKVHFYELSGNKDQVIQALRDEADYLINLRKADTISLKLVQYKLNLKESELRELDLIKNDAENRNRILQMSLKQKKKNQIIFAGAGGGLILFSIIFFILRLKVRRERYEKEIGLLKMNETKLRLDKTEELLQELQTQIANKNSIIQRINEEMALKSSEREEYKSQLDEMKILTDRDWSKFKNLFNSVYPKIDYVLRSNNLELTDGELRILMLYKMDVGKFRIGEILAVSPESVRKAIYRLKKKIEPKLLDDLVANF